MLIHVCGDGQPQWRAVSKIPAPKYTKQTDIPLGGPFERSSSTQLPRANSTQKPKPRSRLVSRPTSATAAQPKQAELRSETSIPRFQSKLPVAPLQAAHAAAAPAEAVESSSHDANDGRFGSPFAQVRQQAAWDFLPNARR